MYLKNSLIHKLKILFTLILLYFRYIYIFIYGIYGKYIVRIYGDVYKEGWAYWKTKNEKKKMVISLIHNLYPDTGKCVLVFMVNGKW